MREYIVTSPIEHDGKKYAIGDTIQLDAPTAAPLIEARGIAEPEIAEIQLAATLRGSDYLPTIIRISSTLTVPQSEAVERAFTASGLDQPGWNGLSDDEREERIVGSLELIREQHLGSALSGPGLGTMTAIAEGMRVLADNADPAPEKRAAEAAVAGIGTGGPGAAATAAAVATALTPAGGGPAGDRVGSIRGVLAQLVPVTDFTSGGDPRIEAVERIVGFKPTRAEIDAARVPVPPVPPVPPETV